MFDNREKKIEKESKNNHSAVFIAVRYSYEIFVDARWGTYGIFHFLESARNTQGFRVKYARSDYTRPGLRNPCAFLGYSTRNPCVILVLFRKWRIP